MSTTHFCLNTKQIALTPLNQCSCTEHGDDGTRQHDMPNGEEWTVSACKCGARFEDASELRQHIAEAAL